jgi:hypothetical protein
MVVIVVEVMVLTGVCLVLVPVAADSYEHSGR